MDQPKPCLYFCFTCIDAFGICSVCCRVPAILTP